MNKTIAVLSLLIFFSMTTVAQKNSEKVLQHVVLFKFKADAKPEDIKKVETAFKALKDQIKEIKAFEWGLNNSPENLNEGYTHCFLVSFSSENDRDAYLPHPKHKEFVAMIGPYLEKALVVDYWKSR
jgi:hypothetical protein